MTVAELFATLGFKVDKSSYDKAKGSAEELKSFLKKTLSAIGIGFSIAELNKFKNDCIQLGSDAEQMHEKFNTVFQGMEEEASQWADSYAESIGRSSNKIKTYISDQQNLLVGFFGTDKRREAMLMSEQMTSLALDLASFANTDEDVAVNAMTKAVMGESEAAKTLGAVLNDATKAQAMETLGLKGKYEALDQATKMQVNYQAILNQSPDAIGDCVRSLDTYESRQRQLEAAQHEYKTYIGMQLIPVQKQFVEWKLKAVKAAESLTKKILGESEEDNKLLSIMQKLNPTFKTMENILKIAGKGFGWMADKIGGTENVIKIFLIALTVFFAYMNAGKVIGFADKASKALKKLFSPGGLKTAAIIGAITLIILVLQDLYSFLKGNDSVIGTIFDKLGIDSEKIRETVINCFNTIKSAIGNALSAAGKFISEHGTELALLGKMIFGVVAAVAAGIAMAKIVPGVMSAASAAIGFLTSPIGLVVAAIVALIAIGVLLYKNWNSIVEYAANMKDSLLNAFENIKAGIESRISNIKASIINGFNAAISWIKSLPSQAVTWGSDFISGLINGITSKIGGLANAVKGTADKIRSFLHFSKPDEGPLADYESWMPDMMGGLAAGIKKGKGSVLKEVRLFAADMSMLVRGRAASPNTVTTNTVSSSRTSNVTQYNEFNNSYTGTQNDAGPIAKGMHKSAVDATTYLARSLAISRG